MRAVDISVVIVSWNAKAYLDECLESLSKGNATLTTEIIVVDNNSADGSPEMVAQKYPETILIQQTENLGFSKANNVGIRIAKGRYIALVNSDVRVLENCLPTLANFLDANQDVGLVAPRTLNTDLSHQSNCRKLPSVWNNFCTAVGLSGLFKKSSFFSGEHMLYSDQSETQDVQVLVGCFWIVRRETFELVGLLDENFFFYAEDVDWSKRCGQAKWRIVHVPEAVAVHHRGGSSSIDPQKFSYQQIKAVLAYWKKHHGRLEVLAIRLIMLFGQGGRALYFYLKSLLPNKNRASTKSKAQGFAKGAKYLLFGSEPQRKL